MIGRPRSPWPNWPCDHDSAIGEIAVVVRDDAQRKGIGGLLMRQLVQIAQELGLTHLHGDMLAENYPMRHLLRSLGLPSTTTIHSGEMHSNHRYAAEGGDAFRMPSHHAWCRRSIAANMGIQLWGASRCKVRKPSTLGQSEAHMRSLQLTSG